MRGSGIYVTHCILQKTVGLVLGWDIFSTSAAAAYSILLDQCFKRAAAHRLRFSFFLDLPDLNRVSFNSLVHQDLVAALADGKLDGLLIASAQGPEQEFWLRQQGVPAVSLNIGGIPNSVVVDRAKIIATAARELVKAGCKEIGLIASIEVDLDLFARHATEMGFHYEESWIKPAAELPPPQKVDPRTRGITAAKEIMDAASTGLTPRMPDGLIITDDVIASGVCSYLSKHYVIGRDIKIACHANKGSPVLDPWQDVLIRCEIDPAEIAEVMFSMLETLMDGKALGQRHRDHSAASQAAGRRVGRSDAILSRL